MQQIIDCERYGRVDIPNVPRVFNNAGIIANSMKLKYAALWSNAARDIANIH
ncbi:MAG TPA: hypothetical protein VJL39_00855 [Candidatus Paceibacterota bacterium]